MVLPGVVGFKLLGKLRDGVTATDLVLTVTQMLRKHGVVGKFVEFYGKQSNNMAAKFSLIFTSIFLNDYSFVWEMVAGFFFFFFPLKVLGCHMVH